MTDAEDLFWFASTERPAVVHNGRAYARGSGNFGLWGGAKVAEGVEDGTYTEPVPLRDEEDN